MKTRFDFCHCVGVLTVDTTFVAVWFGTSKRDLRILKQCEQLRFLRDVYFHRHDGDSASFIQRVAASLFPGCTFPLLRLCQATMSAPEFMRFLRDKHVIPTHSTRAAYHTLRSVDPRFYANNMKL